MPCPKGNNRRMNKLDSIAKQLERQSKPPVHLWKPETVGTIDIEIDAQGNWFHEGGSIQRPALVKLFASVLWHQDQQHFLITPVEKLAIKVEDAAFIAQHAELIDGAWVVTTNVDEQLIIGADIPVELREYQGQWIPYINVRYDLWARVSRSVYYEWVTRAAEQQKTEQEPLVLTSLAYEFEVAKF